MKRLTVPAIETLMFVFLVASGVGLRLYFQDLPNFAPVAAVALFAGYWFRSALLAAAVPLAIMLITDSVIGSYDLRVMAVVYAMLTFPVCLRQFVKRGNVATSMAGGVVASLLFFVATNFAVWVFFDFYDSSAVGLLNCYVRALPFFRFTLLGDACFSLVLFGGHAMAVRFLERAARTEQRLIESV